MSNQFLDQGQTTSPPEVGHPKFPLIIAQAGPNASRSFLEFFVATIRNPNTRTAYLAAVRRFLEWVQSKGFSLEQIEPLIVAAYIELMVAQKSAPTVNQHLAAIRQFFDYLVLKHVIKINPASAVKGPKHHRSKGRTPVLSGEVAKALLDGIETRTVLGLRDRAIIGVMIYTFARVGATSLLKVEDYYHVGRNSFLRLHEKGGKETLVPVHHKLIEYLEAYFDVAHHREDKKGWLFRSAPGTSGRLTARPMDTDSIYDMILRRAKQAGITADVCCHSFRATGITLYLKNGGTLEHAQRIAGHESPATTKLYDRRDDDISLDELEKIVL